MRPSTRSAVIAVVAAAIALAVVSVPVLLRSGDDEPPAPSPTPTPGITATAKEITSAPQVSPELRGAVTEDIERMLVTFYERAFTAPQPAEPGEQEPPEASPTPPPPSARVAASMTTIARRALRSDPGVFDEAADLDVHSGAVTFTGVITFDGKRPLEALIDVNFLGEGAPIGSRSPLVRLQQKGTLVLRNTADGWLVDGFDLRFQTAPVPTPDPQEDDA